MFGKIRLTRRQEQSFNGVSVPVLKSGLQKYVRRGMLNRGLACLIELDLFRLVETDDGAAAYVAAQFPDEATCQDGSATRRRAAQRKAKALRTNLLHRLIAMVSEEVSVAEYWLPLVIYDLAMRWREVRQRTESTRLLIDMYKYLVRAKKIRLISDIRAVYGCDLDSASRHDRQEQKRLRAEVLRSLGLESLATGGDAEPDDLLAACPLAGYGLGLRGDAEGLRLANGLLWCLKQKSDRAFVWLNRLAEHRPPVAWGNEATGRLRRRRNDPLEIVWRMLLEFAQRREALWGNAPQDYPEGFDRLGDILGVLKGWYDTLKHRERPIYLYHALLLVVRRDEIDWTSEIPAIVTPWCEAEAAVHEHLAGKPIDIDDFVLDRHTGRRTRDAHSRFAREGALVANEDFRLRNETYRQVYLALKERQDAENAYPSSASSSPLGVAPPCASGSSF